MPDNPWDSLTEKQKRRVIMWLRGLTVAQIAAVENVHRQSVWDSLSGAFKKIKGLRRMGYDWRRL